MRPRGRDSLEEQVAIRRAGHHGAGPGVARSAAGDGQACPGGARHGDRVSVPPHVPSADPGGRRGAGRAGRIPAAPEAPLLVGLPGGSARAAPGAASGHDPGVERTFGMPILQEWIPGRLDRRINVNATMDRQGRLVTAAVRRNARTAFPSFASVTTTQVSIEEPALIEQVAHLLARLDYAGHASAQFKVDPRDASPSCSSSTAGRGTGSGAASRRARTSRGSASRSSGESWSRRCRPPPDCRCS